METPFGTVLRDLRQSRERSIYQLALDSDLSRSYLGRIEGGKQAPSDEAVLSIARALEATEEETELLRVAAFETRVLLQESARGTSKAPSIATLVLAGKVSKGLGPSIEPNTKLRMEPLPPPGRTRRLPTYGDVSCGWGAVVSSHPESVDDWPEFIAGDADHAIRVRGDSMRDVGYEDGGLVFVKRFKGNPKRIKSGSKVIAHLGDDEYTCKVLMHDRVVSWLQGMAEGWMRPMYLHEHPNLKIVGVVVSYLKREA